MGMLADRHDELGRARTQVTGRLHRLLLELLPGGARKFLSARQARALIATVRPRDLAGKTRRRLAGRERVPGTASGGRLAHGRS
jgi:transposase